MTDHVQIPVQKQGSYDAEHWSDRILTMDVAAERVTVSRRDHPKDLYHHSMHVLGVQTWADMKATNSGHGHNSDAAKMTLHLMGRKVPVVRPDGNSADTRSEASKSTGTHDPSSTSSTPAEHAHVANGGDVDYSWMVRCTTKESYEQLRGLLEHMLHARQKRKADGGHHHGGAEVAPHLPAMPPPVVGATIPTIAGGPIL